MSQYAFELCALVVGDTYGELTSHQIVFWYTTGNRSTTYEANPKAAYTLLRSGKYVDIAKNRISTFAGGVLSNLLALGHARVGDLLEAYGVGNGNNSHESMTTLDAPDVSNSKDRTVTPESVNGTLRKLLELGLVSHVNASHFRSSADNRTEAERAVPSVEIYKAKSKRENEAQWENSVKQKLSEWETGNSAETIDAIVVSKGIKRSHEDPDEHLTNKRQRFHAPMIGITAQTEEAIGVDKGMKRSHEDSGEHLSNKRQRLHGPLIEIKNSVFGAAHSPEIAKADMLDDNIMLQINHAKFAVIMRNDHLIELANQSICASTSRVYATVIQTMEREMHTCKDENVAPDEIGEERDWTSLPCVTTDQLVATIKDTSFLTDALASVDESEIDLAQTGRHEKVRNKGVDDEDKVMIYDNSSSDEKESVPNSGTDSADSSDSDEDEIEIEDEGDGDGEGEEDYPPESALNLAQDPDREKIRDHLRLLAQHPHHFLYHFPQTSTVPERWAIDFTTLSESLARHTLMQTITTRFGAMAIRLIRIMCEEGKIGEKELLQYSLMNQRSMRRILTDLYNADYAAVQEIPRDNSRGSQRTTFLWYFDYERCKAKMLEDSYKCIARSLQRAKVEGDKVRGTVEKASRSDVVGKEEQFLTVQEQEALKNWRAVEERLWGEVGRLDDLIAVIRDF